MSTVPEVLLDAAPATGSRVNQAVAAAVREGLSQTPRWLPAWLFYDEEGSRLFEQITLLPEYYLTRTERAIFTAHADSMIATALQAYAVTGNKRSQTGKLRIIELGAGTASKTGILLAAAVRRQGETDYLPLDVSESAIAEACSSITCTLPQVAIHPQIANYVTDAIDLPAHTGPTLALYIGSSIGNFAPEEAESILANLRGQLSPGDTLLLGTDLVKDENTLLAAYNDAQGITAAFNRNMLTRIHADLGADFDVRSFEHVAIWNAAKSRIEMHLRSLRAQTVRIPSLRMHVSFAEGETIHTENSHKFTRASIDALLQEARFRPLKTWTDERDWFAVTLAVAE